MVREGVCSMGPPDTQFKLMATDEDKNPVSLNKAIYYRVLLPLRIIKFLMMFLVLGLMFSFGSMYMIRFFGVQTVVVRGPAESTFKPCPQPPKALESFFTPPSTLMHGMNDTELLWRASFATQITEYPFKRVPKIAFMFLTRGPLPLAPLWERFFKGHGERYSIYIHSSPSYSPKFPTSSVFYNRRIPSKKVRWGEMSMCDAERRLLGTALLDISNEWFILVSESCIPVQSFNTVYSYISGSKHSFVNSYDQPGGVGRGRYDRRMLPLVRLSDWRKGSQWFEVNRELAIRIVQDTVFYPRFRDFCKPACYVDEHYFPTMLTMQVPHLLANRTLTYMDWSRGGPHPAKFVKADIKKDFLRNRILGGGKKCTYNNRTTKLCFFFARKFAPDALEPLLKLASEVFGF